jgi:hypothetical protein
LVDARGFTTRVSNPSPSYVATTNDVLRGEEERKTEREKERKEERRERKERKKQTNKQTNEDMKDDGH